MNKLFRQFYLINILQMANVTNWNPIKKNEKKNNLLI